MGIDTPGLKIGVSLGHFLLATIRYVTKISVKALILRRGKSLKSLGELAEIPPISRSSYLWKKNARERKASLQSLQDSF